MANISPSTNSLLNSAARSMAKYCSSESLESGFDATVHLFRSLTQVADARFGTARARHAGNRHKYVYAGMLLGYNCPCPRVQVYMLTLAPEISTTLHEAIQQTVWPMMSGLVHDLRQPLSVIDACADYLNLVLPSDDHRARQQLELLQAQVGEANRILHDALLKLHYTDAPRDAASRASTNAASAGVTY
jgi:signal transduction histidine kinase